MVVESTFPAFQTRRTGPAGRWKDPEGPEWFYGGFMPLGKLELCRNGARVRPGVLLNWPAKACLVGRRINIAVQ